MKVIIYKSRGIFMYAYNDSALILHHLLGYKLNDGIKVGFPEIESLDKVKSKLEMSSVNYEILNEYDEAVFCQEFSNNAYENILKVSKDSEEQKKLLMQINRCLEKMTVQNLRDVLMYVRAFGV